METNNLSHRIVFHYAIAIAAVLIVLLGVIHDTRTSMLVAFVGWFAFFMAGLLCVRHGERTFGRSIPGVVLDYIRMFRKSGHDRPIP